MCTLILGILALLLIPVLLLVRLFKRSAPPRIVSTAVATEPGIGWTEEFLFGSQDAENEFITRAMTDINSVQVKNKRKGKADRIRRAFHAKVHAGIKNAKFHVNADIAPNLQSGFLTPGAVYDAWLRFSNASGLVQPDSAKDLRGLVAGIFDNDGTRHDFLGTSAAASHVRDAWQFIEFAKAGAGGKLLMFPRLFWAFGFFETIRMLRMALGQVKRPVFSVCGERYWSRSAYAFGPVAVKFIWSPSQELAALVERRKLLGIKKSDDYLRDDLVEILRQGPAVFDLQIQYWVSGQDTPIEDASVEWLESVSAPITIGQLVIPQQDLESAEAVTAQEEIEGDAFNPWNTTSGIRPLGSQNRARRFVYPSSVEMRQSGDDGDTGGRCPFRPKSKREGIGPYKYVYWNVFYVLMEYLNRKLARDPNRKVSWDKWPSAFGLLYLMAKLRFNRSNALTDPYDYATNDNKGGSEPQSACMFIAADGSYVSDRENGQMGAANTRFGSNIPPKKVRPDVEQMTPSARDAGKLRWRRIDPETGKEIMIPAMILNDLAGGWIQFEFHGFGGNTKRDPVSDNPHQLARDPKDNWPGNVAYVDRTSIDHTRVTNNGRVTVINEKVQAWVQGQLYGNSPEELAALRSFEGGKMRLDENGMLPEDPRRKGVDLTGFSNNYNPELSLLHWLFTVEHNAIAEHYAYFHPEWDDETLFQMARKVNCAQISRIHTIQWTEDLLQHPTLQIGMHADWYGLIGPRLKLYLMRLSHRHPWVRTLLTPLRNNDFIWGMPGSKWEHHDGPFQVPKHFRLVYRLHEMLLGVHEIVEPGTNRTLDRIDLINFVHHNTRPIVEKFGYDVLAWSFVKKSCGALTLHNFPRALTQFQNMQDGTLTDLAERDLFREVTDGTGTYNEFRLSVGEPPVTSFMELTGGDAELARELEIKYEGDVDAVHAGIGILAEPKPAGFALGFCQFYQFVLNAPRRVKSNRHLSEGYSYDGYAEGLDWVEHGGGMLGVMRRHLPKLREQMEGVTRAFAPWPETETFPLRMLTKTYEDIAKVFKADLRTMVLGAVAGAVAVWGGVASLSTVLLLLLAYATGCGALAVTRMLAMRFMQLVWKKCYTDKRGLMFPTLYRSERRLRRAAFGGRFGSLAVILGSGVLAWTVFSQLPVLSVLLVLTGLSAISIWRGSRQFVADAEVMKIALRNRMREGQPVATAATAPVNFVNLRELDHNFRLYAPGREYMTAYDFARMHEGHRVRAAAEGSANCISRLINELVANRRAGKLLHRFADQIVDEDRKLVPAISKEMLVRVNQGLAQVDLTREENIKF